MSLAVTNSRIIRVQSLLSLSLSHVINRGRSVLYTIVWLVIIQVDNNDCLWCVSLLITLNEALVQRIAVLLGAHTAPSACDRRSSSI